MKNKILALILAFVFVFSLIGCSSDKPSTSSDGEISEVVNGNEDVANNDKEQNDTVSDKKEETAPKNENKDGSIDMNSLKGKTISLLMWRDLRKEESTAISNFQNSTQIKVKITTTNWNNYMTKLASMVSVGDSPDVAVIPSNQNSQGAFPLGAASVFQPISVTKQDLNDSFWNKEAMQYFKIKGREYVFIASNSNWFNTSAVVYYNEDIFKETGVTTPRELWKSGKWNWDTLKSTAQAITAKGYTGYVNQQYNNLMLSTGHDYISYDGKTFKSEIISQNMIKAWTFNSEMVEAGYQLPYASSTALMQHFSQGKAGMMGSNIWLMLKTEGLSSIEFSVDAVPFPAPAGQKLKVVSGTNRFGIPKGAKEPVAAGVFIRDFLDSKNNGKFSDVALNPKMEDTFNYVTGKNMKGPFNQAIGVIGYTNLANLKTLEEKLSKTSSSQITTVLQQNKAFVDNAVNNVNKKLGN